MTSGYRLGLYAKSAAKRRERWIPRVIRYLQHTGPMTFPQLRNHRKMAHLPSDEWLRKLLLRMERADLIVWDPDTDLISLARAHDARGPST